MKNRCIGPGWQQGGPCDSWAGDDGGSDQAGGVEWKEVVSFWIYFENGVDGICKSLVYGILKRERNQGCLQSLELEPWRGRDAFSTAEKTLGGIRFGELRQPSLPA